MARDVGGYFEKLTRKGRGGRRLDGTEDHESPDRDATTPPRSAPTSSGGGLGDVLRDILGKGRSTATTAGKRARDSARSRIDRRRSDSTRSRSEPRSLPPESVVTVEYSPRIDGDPDPGEVVWTWVPYEEDPEQGKDRPVVVIGRRGRSLVGVPLTTRENDREAQVSIGTGDWDPKRRRSYARIWRMLDIDAGRTRREGAVLDRDRFDDVIAAVDRFYEVRRPARTGGPDDEPDDY